MPDCEGADRNEQPIFDDTDAGRARYIRELEAKARWLDFILEHAPINIYVKDASGGFLAVNRHFEQSFDITLDELQQRADPAYLGNAVLEMANGQDASVLKTGQASVQDEVIGQRTYRVIKHPVRDETGRIHQIIGFDIDITDMKLALEDAQSSRLAAEAANERLKELDRLKSVFIASMSHELRTPLNSIIGFTSLMLDGKIGEINEVQKDRLNRVRRAGRHLLSLISDVIDISKIEAGRLEANVTRFSLTDMVDEAVGAIEPQQLTKGLELEVDIPHDLEMCTDRRRLMQCVLNCLSNAVKYTESGKVTVTARQAGRDVEISVRDSGIGIQQEDMPRLFEAFERLDTQMRVKAGGTGLGLYLTRKIATELLDGSISADSVPDKGSTFRIRVAKSLHAIPADNGPGNWTARADAI